MIKPQCPGRHEASHLAPLGFCQCSGKTEPKKQKQNQTKTKTKPGFLLYKLVVKKKKVHRKSRLCKRSKIKVHNGLRVVYSSQTHGSADDKYLIKRILGIRL